jgi:putative nucleotidyltransferase with HDIG domain
MNSDIAARIEADAVIFADRHRESATALQAIGTASAETVFSLMASVDPRVADTTLHLVNSGYFGLPESARSIPHALELMGGERLARVALTAWAFDLLSAPLSGYDLPAGDLWRHALGVAIAAEHLSESLPGDRAESVFTAGIFHDVGKRVMGPYLDGASDRVESKTEEDLSFEAAEAAVLGIDHAALSSRILAAWRFPDEVIEAVRRSHAPDREAPPSILADLLHVSDVLCLTIGIGTGREGLKYKASPTATKRLNATTGTLELVASHTLQWTNELADLPGSP